MYSINIDDLGFFVPEKTVNKFVKKKENKMAEINKESFIIELDNRGEGEIKKAFTFPDSSRDFDITKSFFPRFDFNIELFGKEHFKPTRVIFNGTTTVCYFGEDKVVAQLLPGDCYVMEKGLALCVAKYALGGYNSFRKLLDNAEEYNIKERWESEGEHLPF